MWVLCWLVVQSWVLCDVSIVLTCGEMLGVLLFGYCADWGCNARVGVYFLIKPQMMRSHHC